VREREGENVPRRLLKRNWSSLLISSGYWQWYWITLIKSVLVRRPANFELRESHRGAETMAGQVCQPMDDDNNKQDVRIAVLFWIRMLRLFFIRRSVSRTMSRKDIGKTS